MNLVNHTHYAADYTSATDKSGRVHLLLVVKATYRLPLGGEPAQLLEEQIAPVMADTATGAPGLSAPEYECEYVLHKPRCEVLLLGSAYATRGRAVRRLEAGFRLGALSKSFYVYGKRFWQDGLLGIGPGEAAHFTRQPIGYDIAFGGAEHNPANPDRRAAYPPNPVGLGYQKKIKTAWLAGMPMAQTEEIRTPIISPNQAVRPMALGPLGRHWTPRLHYAGTYDAHWEEEIFPFLPPDFDERYFQSAPEDQQLDALASGETVTLLNLTHPALTPSGWLDFALPDLSLGVTMHPKKGGAEARPARADTLFLEPDKQRFSVTWRAAWPLRRSLDEVEEVEVGQKPPVRGTGGATAANPCGCPTPEKAS